MFNEASNVFDFAVASCFVCRSLCGPQFVGPLLVGPLLVGPLLVVVVNPIGAHLDPLRVKSLSLLLLC